MQRANLFGQVVHSQRRTSVTSPPVSPPASGDAPPSMVRQTTEGSIKHPVPPVRRKVSTKSLKQAPSVPYDVPKPPGELLCTAYLYITVAQNTIQCAQVIAALYIILYPLISKY